LDWIKSGLGAELYPSFVVDWFPEALRTERVPENHVSVPNIFKSCKMYDLKKIHRINGPAGHLSTRELPAADIVRWTPSRKAEVVLAVIAGLITEDEACRRYRLTPEELSRWRNAYVHHGVRGLKATRPVR
jgi:uncharacterized protein DUF1153